VAIFGGGYDATFPFGQEVAASDAHRGRAIYIVDVETGKILYKGTRGKNGDKEDVLFAPMPAPPAAADLDDDGYLDVAYIGDLNGRMWKLDLRPDGTARRGVLSDGTLQYQPLLLYDAAKSTSQPIQPIFLEAGIIFIAGGDPATVGVAFGTGNRAELVEPNRSVNRFHFVIDNGSGATLNDTDLVNITPAGARTTPTATSAGSGPAPVGNGYFLDFATVNEKAVSTVFSTRGNLTLVTFTPDSGNPCATTGSSYRYQFFFAGVGGGYSLTPPAGTGPGSIDDYRQYIGRGLAEVTQSFSPEGGMIDTVLFSGSGINQRHTPATLKTINQNWKEQ